MMYSNLSPHKKGTRDPGSNIIAGRKTRNKQTPFQKLVNTSPKIKAQALALQRAGLMSQPKTPSAQVLQRITYEDLRGDHSIPQSFFMKILLWLGSRVGNIEGESFEASNWNRFLAPLSKEEVLNYTHRHDENTTLENQTIWTLEDVIKAGSFHPGVNWDLAVDHIQASSLGKFATGLKIEEDPIEVMDDSEFSQAHLKEYKAVKKKRELTEGELFDEQRGLDMVNGFHSQTNGKIYMRRAAVIQENYHYLIHEMVHKCSSPAFAEALGHVLNEAATEHFAARICREKIIPVSAGVYPKEQALLEKIGANPGFSEPDLENAYFQGNTDLIVIPLQKKLKGDFKDFTQVAIQDAEMIYTLSTEVQPLDLDLGDFGSIIVHSGAESQVKGKTQEEPIIDK